MQALASKSPAYFSFPQQWNAQDLADAVPRRLRLSQMVDFDALQSQWELPRARSGARRKASRPWPLPRDSGPRLFRVG